MSKGGGCGKVLGERHGRPGSHYRRLVDSESSDLHDASGQPGTPCVAYRWKELSIIGFGEGLSIQSAGVVGVGARDVFCNVKLITQGGEGRLRPFSGGAGNRPGVYAGWRAAPAFPYHQLSARFTGLLSSGCHRASRVNAADMARPNPA
jgi:hypothetical protein